MIIIFVEFIDQLIDYPINCASLTYIQSSVHPSDHPKWSLQTIKLLRAWIVGAHWNFLAEVLLTSGHGLCFRLKYEECQFFFYLKNFQPSTFVADNILEKKIIIFQKKKNRTWHFMWIICWADNSHEKSLKSYIYKKKKYFKMSSAAVVVQISTLRVNLLTIWFLHSCLKIHRSLEVKKKKYRVWLTALQCLQNTVFAEIFGLIYSATLLHKCMDLFTAVQYLMDCLLDLQNYIVCIKKTKKKQ